MKHYAAATALICSMALPVTAETWDMPTPYGDTTFHTQNIMQFAKDVAEATGGELDFTVHSAGSLFPHPEIKNAVRSGQAPIGEFFLSTLENEDTVFGLDSQPFLATSPEDAMRLWQAQKPVITKLLEEQGLTPLYSVAWPAQGLYTNGEIKTVDGFKGLRFRAYNAALEEFASLAGAAPVQVEAPDIPQAFATGQVESMMTSPTTGATSSAWDFVSHYSPINAWIPKNIVVVNTRAFGRLPENVQKAVLDAAAKAEARGWEMALADAESSTKTLVENGMTIYEPSAELSEGLQAIGATMLENLRKKGSESTTAVLDAYLQ